MFIHVHIYALVRIEKFFLKWLYLKVYSIVHEIVHLNLKLLVREIFMCFEVIWIVHVSSHSILLKLFEIIVIVHSYFGKFR